MKYDKLEHALKEHIYEREDYVNAAFNARYSTDNFVATHTLGFVWSHNPGSGSGSRDVWSHNIFDSQSSTSFSKGRASSPQVSGEYFARLSKKVGLLGYWQYSHSNSRQEFASQFVPSPEISNLTKEHVNSCKFLVQPYFKPSSKLFFQLTVESMLDWYKTYYSGSTEAKALQARQELKSNLRASWKPLDNIILTFKPGLSASLWKIGGTRQHSVRPTVEADLNASFGSKFYLSTSAIVYMRSPSASESNPTVVRSSELLWLAGDPGLKSLFSWNLSNQLTFLAARWLDFSWGVSYSRSSNQIIPSYKAATSGMGGIIKMMQNAPAENDISTSMTVTGKFFDGDLSVYLSPKLFYFDVNGKYASKFTFATVSGGIDYYYKDFSFSVWYDNPYKDISMAGMERSWEEGSWSASVDYGNDNLKLRLRVDDIFNDKKKSWTKYESPTFSSMLNSFKTGRQISLSVSYVFGYGKKVSQSIDVESPSSIKTSVIRGRGL